MRTCIAGAVLMVIGWVAGTGCVQQKPKDVPPPPPPAPKITVTAPNGNLTKDYEGVRRVAVSITLEEQPNGRKIGKGFTSVAGVVDLELAQALDEVVRQTVASAFKELGFNVAQVAPVIPDTPATVRTAVEAAKADYLAVPTINTFEINTTPTANAPAFGTVVMDVQLFGPRGGLVVAIPVSISTAWTLKGEKPGPEQMRTCVEEVLKQIKQKIMTDPNLLKSLGLELPEPATTTPAK